MTLVDYGSDSSDEEQPQVPPPAAAIPQDNQLKKSLFAALPAPKNRRGEKKKIIVEAPVERHLSEQPEQKAEKSVVVERGPSGLSALLPAPKSRTTASEPVTKTSSGPSTTGNGPSLMTQSDDKVVMKGNNTLFKPKSIPPISRPKNTPTTTKSSTPKLSLFSIPPTEVPKRDVQESTADRYEPLLATESRPRPLSIALPETSDADREEGVIETSESYRYDPSIDYDAVYASQHDTESSTAGPNKKRRRGHEEPLVMQEYDAAQQYAQNEAFIASGAGDEAAPVRFVGTGKHQLSSLLSLAHSQKDALEESFASQKRAMREGKNKYGR